MGDNEQRGGTRKIRRGKTGLTTHDNKTSREFDRERRRSKKTREVTGEKADDIFDRW